MQQWRRRTTTGAGQAETHQASQGSTKEHWMDRGGSRNSGRKYEYPTWEMRGQSIGYD